MRAWNRKLGNIILGTWHEATEDPGRREGIVGTEILKLGQVRRGNEGTSLSR